MATQNQQIDTGFIQRVARFCLGEKTKLATPERPGLFGRAYTRWDGDKTLLDAAGNPPPITLDANGKFADTPPEMKYMRVATTLNQMVALGCQKPLRIDMHDARPYGRTQKNAVNWPVVVYNRRPDAKNMVLWPLAKYHDLGSEKFVHPAPIDTLAFDRKIDNVRWRGNLSGRPNVALAPHMRKRRPAEKIMRDIETATSDDTLWQLNQELMGITRYNVVARYYKSNDFDVGLTLRKHHRKAGTTPLLAPFCKAREPVSWFFGSKYILSLSGNDTGSNFLMSVNSNSVVLKEEDGWALFYSGEFHPWVHYIPLAPGATDLEEKLAWARQNQPACKEMVKAAHSVCARFASAKMRQMILRNVLEEI